MSAKRGLVLYFLPCALWQKQVQVTFGMSYKFWASNRNEMAQTENNLCNAGNKIPYYVAAINKIHQ